MRIVGGFYLLKFVMVTFVQAPIRTIGPKDALDQAASGEPMARFLVDTWTTYGLQTGALGVALLIASRIPEQATVLIWTIIGIELLLGIVNDVYMVARGYEFTVYLSWILIHSLIVVTGLLVLLKKDKP
jgi:hypothetical protein